MDEANKRLTGWYAEQLSRQCRKYGISVRMGMSAARRDGDLARQGRDYARQVERQKWLELATKTVLNRRGVSTISYVKYYNFVRHLARMQGLCSGESLELEARAAVTRWTAVGLRQEILLELCAAVLGIEPGLAEVPGSEVELDSAGGERAASGRDRSTERSRPADRQRSPPASKF